jgi:hypothetical protein
MPYTADRRLFLNADKSAVVEEGDASAAFLLAAPGDELTDDEAKQYGLKSKGKAEDKQAAPAEDKADTSEDAADAGDETADAKPARRTKK